MYRTFIKNNFTYPLRIAKRLILTGSIHSKKYIECLNSIAHQNLLNKAILNFSIDIELLDERKAERSRRIFDELISLVKEHSLSLTWAVMGNINSINLSFPYLIEKIISVPNQEIASHSFSHPDFTSLNKQEAIDDIKSSLRCFNERGLSPKTFIFPWNKAGYIEEIKKAGFESYRGYSNQTIHRDKEGLIVFPADLCLNPSGFTSKEIISLIDEAVRYKILINIFTHLLEFRDEVELNNFLEPIFSYVKMCENNDQLDTMTMREITDDIGKGIAGLL